MKIKINNLVKSYEKTVLNNISLNVEDHNSIAIIGKSGCGKSTLLRMLTGIEKFDEGEIYIDDFKINEANKKQFQKEIGVVFQTHNLFPHLSVLENITIILERTRGVEKEVAKTKAIEILEKLELKDQLYKKPSEISGGQAQRASIARALVTDSKYVFLDEPTASLDPLLTYEVLESIKTLKNSGIKFIFVTHEINFVKQFADYVIFMDEGEIIEQGSPTILDSPKSQELKTFTDKVI